MKYFITGATGFIGGKLAKRLIDDGHEVVASVRSPAKAVHLKELGIQLAQGDITDKASLRQPMTGVDGVFHIAAWYKVGARDSSMAETINVDGTRNVLELMQELGISRGVYTSTLAINSDTKSQMVDESYRFTGKHLTVYDQTKYDAHFKVAEPMVRAGLPLVTVMPGAVYGPGDGSDLRDVLVNVIRGRMPFVPDDTALCFAHVDDIVDGHILAMEKGKLGEDYIIAGEPMLLKDYFRKAAELAGVRPPMLTLPPALLKVNAAVSGVLERVIPLPAMFSSEALRTTAGVTYWGDNSKAKRELGYNPRLVAEGLPETVAYELALLKK